MKYLMLLVVTLMFSCSKSTTQNKAKCYTCTFTNGASIVKKDICTNQIDSVRYYDPITNAAYSSSCELK